LCIVRCENVYTTHTPNVREYDHGYYENGCNKRRSYLETPVGTLSKLFVSTEATASIVEKMFKSPDDYKALAFFIGDHVYRENYSAFIETENELGGDAFCRTGIGYDPLQEILWNLMGVETFCVEWMERRDEVLKIYQLLTENRRKVYRLFAESPALAINYGGNISPEIVGLERFREYMAPHFYEAAEEIHKHGKLIGIHLDGNNKLLAPEIAKIPFDYIDSFTSPPNGDMSVWEAFEAWKDKVIWINFPPSLHTANEATIEHVTRDILRQAIPGDRLIFEISESIPRNSRDYQRSLTTITRVLNENGRLPLRT